MNLNGYILAIAVAMVLQVPGVQRGASSSGLIVGQVVDGDTGRPVPGAIVTMTGPPSPGSPSHPSILTGDDGRFVYRALRRGNYNILATKPGYAGGAHGRTRPAGPARPLALLDGERTGDVVIRVWRHAAISGTVVDEAGERLIGVRVQAYRRAILAGQRRYVATGSANTDDRGVYRISGLIPGDYIVGVVARHMIVPVSMARELSAPTTVSGAARSAGIGPLGSASPMLQFGDAAYVLGVGTPTPPPAQDGRLAVYPPTFHPNAASGDAASPISVRAGSEYLSGDIQLHPVPTVSVSGFVSGPDGPVIATALGLVAAGITEVVLGGAALEALTDRAGRFTFPAVPSGHYELKLTRGGNSSQRGIAPAIVWADVPVNVGTDPIENLGVEAQPGVRIGGRIQFDGTLRNDPYRRGVTIAIEPADAIAGAAISVRADERGEFVSPPLRGGRYYVRVPDSPSGWMFRDATAAGRDVVDTAMQVTSDALDVVVTFTDRWSGIRGFVQDRQGPDPEAAVLIFPTDTGMWGSSGLNPRRIRMVRPDRTGQYSANLPPGEYFVLAVPDEAAADWQDPAFLDAASRMAPRVRIAEGERRVQDLRTREVR